MLKKGQIVTFKKGVNAQIKAGSQWVVIMEGNEKGNTMLNKLGKNGKPLKWESNPMNLYGLHKNDFAKLVAADLIEI